MFQPLPKQLACAFLSAVKQQRAGGMQTSPAPLGVIGLGQIFAVQSEHHTKPL